MEKSSISSSKSLAGIVSLEEYMPSFIRSPVWISVVETLGFKATLNVKVTEKHVCVFFMLCLNIYGTCHGPLRTHAIIFILNSFISVLNFKT